MDTTHCITNADWERYATGELAAKELHALQTHVALCELCSDIKVGIDAMAQPTTLKEKVAAINADADKRLQRRKPRRMIVWYWSSAAAIVITLGLGFLLLNKADDQLTASGMNKPAAVIESAHDSSAGEETVTPETDAGYTPLADNRKYNKAPAPEKMIIADEQETTDDAKVPAAEYKAEYRATDKDLNREENKPMVGETDFEVLEKPAAKTDTTANFFVSDITLTETKKKSATLPAPNYMSNNGAFSNATLNANGVNHYFSWDFSDSTEYSNAVVYYDSAKYDSCLTTIKRLTESPASYHYEDALLLKAKALIKQGKKKEAKKVLKSVIALNGTRKQEAEGYLKTVK